MLKSKIKIEIKAFVICPICDNEFETKAPIRIVQNKKWNYPGISYDTGTIYIYSYDKRATCLKCLNTFEVETD